LTFANTVFADQNLLTTSDVQFNTISGTFNGILGDVTLGEIVISSNLVINESGIFATDNLGNETFSLFANTGALELRDIMLSDIDFADQELFTTSDVTFDQINYGSIYSGVTRKDTLWDLAYAERGSVIAGNKISWNATSGQLDLDVLNYDDVDFSDQNLLTTSDVSFNSIDLVSGIILGGDLVPDTDNTGEVGTAAAT